MKISGAKALIESLKTEGVEVIFGYPGGAVLEIYDEIFKTDIRHILTRHEQGAAHAAEGYAKSTGKVGVCLATSGPGATNLVTGIADAHMDSVPLVVLTGQVGTSYIGKDAFQEADITGITLPIVKHSYQVRHPEEIPRIVKEAFYIARTGRPGPVLIDLPKDVTIQQATYKVAGEVSLPSYKPTSKGNPRQIAQAAKAVFQAGKPVLYVGGGVIISGAEQELLEIAEVMQIPVTYTLMGKGAFPDDHPLALRMLGMHGTAYANHAVNECDLLITVGARFDDRVTGKVDTFAPEAKVIHIDVDPAEIGKNVVPDIPIVGDAKLVLQDLLKELKHLKEKGAESKTRDWIEQVKAWKHKYPLASADSAERISHVHILEEINELTHGDCIVTTDVGQHQMWAAQYVDSKPRNWLTSGGLGTMGFGFPAAIGAKVGRPEMPVFCVTGDGSFQMNLQELGTVMAEKIPVIICLFNNRYLGMVRQWQELFYDRRYSYVDLSKGTPDFVKLLEAYGLKGIRVNHSSEVRPALEAALKAGVTTLIDFNIAEEESVFPMIPAGTGVSKMMVSKEGEQK